ncbi:50S ribosomal protein L1 [bacterium]|nr:50S ribosomal protein L1 [bacterium]
MQQSKRYRQAAEKVGQDKLYAIDEAIGLLKSLGNAGFDETVEVALRLGIDTKSPDQAVRGTISLPKGIGRTLRVIVFAEGDAADAARAAGADEVGTQELVDKVQGGWLEFDVAIAEPSLMRLVGRLGRVLGPRGLMPSPKSGTVTADVGPAVVEFKAGKIEYRADSTGNVHAPVGKKTFAVEDLEANVEAFIEHIRQAKPAATKGRYILSATLSSTMGPAIHLAVS